MENAIKKLIEIENEAQKLVEEGYSQSERIRQETLKELKNMECNINEMANYKIDQLSRKSRLDADEKIKKINESTQKRIRVLEDYVENNRETWGNQIFSRILER
ncbi:MAG: hypothetical protein GX236_01810 [Clostridiaceae bacterium]|nr:hypothetical protein [Clostridiaceae bacterium]